jgi:hypothetical protein
MNSGNNNKIVTCNGCHYFYVTYKKERPWGCKKFGFISKFIPSREVLTQLVQNVHIGLRRLIINFLLNF